MCLSQTQGPYQCYGLANLLFGVSINHSLTKQYPNAFPGREHHMEEASNHDFIKNCESAELWNILVAYLETKINS